MQYCSIAIFKNTVKGQCKLVKPDSTKSICKTANIIPLRCGTRLWNYYFYFRRFGVQLEMWGQRRDFRRREKGRGWAVEFSGRSVAGNDLRKAPAVGLKTWWLKDRNTGRHGEKRERDSITRETWWCLIGGILADSFPKDKYKKPGYCTEPWYWFFFSFI